MRAIGFSAAKDEVAWAVVGSDSDVIVAYDKIKSPPTFSLGQSLSHFRDAVRTIVSQYEVEAAGIKLPDNKIPGKPDRTSRERLRIEGVVLEAIYSCGITPLAGMWHAIGANLDSKAPRGYLTKDAVRGFEFKQKNDSHKQAVIAAVAALEGANG